MTKRALRAAIYARYSSDKQREESIADQVRKCSEYAAQRGWEIVATYADPDVSGEGVPRPDYERMQADALRGMLDVVIADTVARFDRQPSRVHHWWEQLKFRGIGMHTAAQGEMDTLKLSIFAGIAANYLETLRHETRRGLEGKVLEGLSAGGIPYGYRADPNTPGGRIIDEEQAAVVRRIFALYADAVSPRSIAATLNSEGIPAPRHARIKGDGTWGDTTIRGQAARGNGILNNEIYVGKLVWNRCSYVKDPDTGMRQARPNPPEKWSVIDVPELRIIDDETWAKVKVRQTEVRTEMSRDGSGNALNRAHRKKYLLSGLIYCGCCGSPYVIADSYRYRCSRNRSKSTCPNDIQIKRADLESRVADALRHRMMASDTVEAMLRKINSLHAEEAGQAETVRTSLAAKLRSLDSQIDNITDILAEGRKSPALLSKLERLEADRAKVATEIADIDASAGLPFPPLDAEKVTAAYKLLMDEIRLLLTPDATSDKEEQLSPLRELVRSMIERITVQPNEDGDALILFEGSFTGALAAAGVVELAEKQSPLAGGQGALTVGGCGSRI